MRTLVASIVVLGLLAGAWRVEAYVRIISDDGDNECLVYDKRQYKAWKSQRLSNIWPTKKSDWQWKSRLKKAKSAMICYGDSFCAFGLCIRTMTGAYFTNKGSVAARISGVKWWTATQTCWEPTVDGVPVPEHCV